MPEIWKPIVGFEGRYAVSSEGQVRNELTGKHLKGTIRSDGYLVVTLDQYPHRRHVLVATAFHGPCPAGQECRHKDGVRVNCAEGNLEWGTRKQNIADKILHGTANRGDACNWAKHPAGIIAAVREANGTHREIATKYGLSQSHVTRLKNGTRRGHEIA